MKFEIKKQETQLLGISNKPNLTFVNQRKVFYQSPEVLVMMIAQIFTNNEVHPFSISDLKKCLEHGIYLNNNMSYEFKELNWRRSIGNAISVLIEIGYNISIEKRKYYYVPAYKTNLYIIQQAIQSKNRIIFDYKNQVHDELNKLNNAIADVKDFDEANSKMDAILYTKNIIMSPYDVVGNQVLCGKKSNHINEKTYDFYVYDYSRMENIRILEKSKGARFYPIEKAISRLPADFLINYGELNDASKTIISSSELILRKRIPFFKTYEISYYQDYTSTLFNDIFEKFTNCEEITKAKAKKEYIKFTHYDEDDVFNFIKQKNTKTLKIKFNKEQQKRYEEWLQRQEKKD